MYPSSYRSGAAAHISGGPDHPELTGFVVFAPDDRGVLVSTHVTGLPKENEHGFFALHIHEGTACAGDGFSATGSHYNPTEALHPGHAGDLPPLLSCAGNAYSQVLTNRFAIPDIIGRTVVIHSGPDDFRSQPAGNAGDKIACGVIYRT